MAYIIKLLLGCSGKGTLAAAGALLGAGAGAGAGALAAALAAVENGGAGGLVRVDPDIILLYSTMKKINVWFFVCLFLIVGFGIYILLTVQQPPPTVPIIEKTRVVYVNEKPSVPEARPPPYKNYKPMEYQQVGILLGTNETLPLYGKPSYAYNSRWNYYTTTPGQQIYPLPVTYEDRDCTEDIGCNEMYDNQSVSVVGRSEPFTTKIYRTVLGF